MSRPARVFFLALATSLLIYYHSTILALSGFHREPQPQPVPDIQWPTPPTPPSAGAFKDPIPDAKPPVPAADASASAFNELKFPFQEDLTQYRQPKLPLASLTAYAPHNDYGPGQFAYATYLSTRNNSIHDPYFLSAQQLVYRLLWSPTSRSAFFPVVVFVAPFIPQEQRDILRAQGAIVRELDLVPWDPPKNEDGDIFPFARWRDLFSKLNIWAQTDFLRIAFLDLDAFPVQNLDAIFDQAVAPRQKCKANLLPAEDKPHAKDMCDYVWAGHGGQGGINVGVIVLEPNKYMHARLLRESQDTSKFDNKMAEQAFLNYAFEEQGPFPPTFLGREWNGYYPTAEDEGKVKVVHEKLWILGDGWTKGIFAQGWKEILELYESERFVEMRKLDGLVKTGRGF